MERRRVLITGASRGIGAAVAHAFASQGDDVAIHYFRSEAQAKQVAHSCSLFGVRAFLVCADLQRPQGVQRLVAAMREEKFFPDVLVNNAGTSTPRLFQEVSCEEWMNGVLLHQAAPFFCTQAFLPHMIRQRFGRVINLSSIWGERGAAMESLYSMAKGAVNAWTRALAKEVASTGVTVNAVAPGAIETEMNASLTPEERLLLNEEIPMRRMGEPREVASLVTFLASREASYVTGQVMSPNGGWF